MTATYTEVAPFFAAAFLTTFLGNYAVNRIGHQHYDLDSQHTIFDFGHMALPRWRVRDHEIILLEALPLLSVFVKGVGPVMTAVPDIMLVFGWVLLLRILTSVATILPKDDECDADKFGLKQVISGFCFDKLFSGHTAFSVIVAMVLVKHGIWSPNLAWIYPVWMGLYLLLTRGHYTSDVILGAIIAFLMSRLLL
jgi:membrane-associated phospholipid phosphatase